MSNYEKILKAATKLMSGKGYHGTSIQMMADEVGITKSTIIHHFTSKEGILSAILKEFVPMATKELMKITKDKNLSGLEKLKIFIKSHMHAVVEHRDVLDLYLRESRYFGTEHRKIYQKNGRAYLRQAENIVKQVQVENKDILAGLSAKVVANAIMGMINYATVWYQKSGKLNEKQLVEHFFKVVAGNIKSGPKKVEKRD